MFAIENTVALLSIHSEFAEAILTGKKTVEFRKTKFSRPVKYILLYATRPVGEIVGLIELKNTHHGSPKQIWKSFGKSGAISKQRFFEYYRHNDQSVALEIEQAWSFGKGLSLSDIGISRAPQSFVYTDVGDVQKLGNRVKLNPVIAA